MVAAVDLVGGNLVMVHRDLVSPNLLCLIQLGPELAMTADKGSSAHTHLNVRCHIIVRLAHLVKNTKSPV